LTNNLPSPIELLQDVCPPTSSHLDEIPLGIEIENSQATKEKTVNLKRPVSLTATSSNPPSPKYDSSQENNISNKPP